MPPLNNQGFDMRLLDLFCGAGGCSAGYHRAGFQVVGVDIAQQPHYPFEFHRADALEFCAAHGHEFDVIHASPPCQGYSVTRPLSNGNHLMLIEETRSALIATGKPYVIENVPRAPLINPLMLCGSMFGLRVYRHRLFECNPPIWFPPAQCNHHGTVTSNRRDKGQKTRRLADGYSFLTVVGHDFILSEARMAMGIDWMNQEEIAQAIPPAYTEWIGRQLFDYLRERTP